MSGGYYVMLVQGTWGDDDAWWVPNQTGNFADAVRAAGHTLINGRPWLWSTQLDGMNPFSSGDLRGWRGAGRHLYDRLDPVPLPWRMCPPASKTPKVAIIAHSHGRQVVKYACHFGLEVDTAIFITGPIRKDVDKETPLARARIKNLICLHGGKRDLTQIAGELFDWRIGAVKHDKEADTNERFPDADHSSLLKDPKNFHRVLAHLQS